jgi:hypothetical protein
MISFVARIVRMSERQLYATLPAEGDAAESLDLPL